MGFHCNLKVKGVTWDVVMSTVKESQNGTSGKKSEIKKKKVRKYHLSLIIFCFDDGTSFAR